MNRFSTRLFAASAGLAACGLVISGCGSGQISQVADQAAAVNGNSADVRNIALRNVHIQAAHTGDSPQPGASVPLLFVAANNLPDADDKLLGITSDIGTVTLTGDATIPAGRALVVGGDVAAQPMGSATPASAEVKLVAPITNGLSYDFTFDFQRAGEATVRVPVSAGEAAG